MKAQHVAAYRLDARAILQSLNIAVGQDFHTLTSAQVDGLLTAADIRRYQKPANAHGSRARYFHDMLQRRANA